MREWQTKEYWELVTNDRSKMNRHEKEPEQKKHPWKALFISRTWSKWIHCSKDRVHDEHTEMAALWCQWTKRHIKHAYGPTTANKRKTSSSANLFRFTPKSQRHSMCFLAYKRLLVDSKRKTTTTRAHVCSLFVRLDNARTIFETAEIYRQPAHITDSIATNCINLIFFHFALLFLLRANVFEQSEQFNEKIKWKKATPRDTMYCTLKLN